MAKIVEMPVKLVQVSVATTMDAWSNIITTIAAVDEHGRLWVKQGHAAWDLVSSPTEPKEAA